MSLSRRDLIRAGAAAGASWIVESPLEGTEVSTQPASRSDKALIAITLDLEMARNFPTWEQTHWDYEKGNLNDDAKRYTLEAARRVKACGGRIHTFLVGQALEQENVDWLMELIREGHFIGNHTYDHVYVLAKTRDEIQFRFKRAPWLIDGKSIEQAIRENVEMCTRAMKTRLGIAPAGFRTPGGFITALDGRTDVQQMLLDLGFKWVSSKYPPIPDNEPGKALTPELLDGLLKAQPLAQPYVYPTGLIEVPMSPISDITAFRVWRWKLADFLKVTQKGVEWAIEHRATFDFLSHPSALGVVDPEFKTIDLICRLVGEAGDRAMIADLGTLSHRARPTT